MEGPFFVCSREILKGQVERLSSLGAEVFYSTKTNPEPSILKSLQGIGAGFSVSSPEEFLTVTAMNAKPEKIYYYERGLSKEKAGWLKKAGGRNFVVESKAAFDNLLPVTDEEDTLLIRLKADNPGNEFSSSYVPGLQPSEARGLLSECRRRGLKTGILHHNASQVEGVGIWKGKFKTLSKFSGLDVINLGGGIPISYGRKTNSAVLKEIEKGVGKLDAERIIVEPGRFIVGPACSLVTKAVLVDGRNIVLNASVYNTHIDTIIAKLVLPCRAGKGGKADKIYRLLGSSLCNLDIFNDRARLPETDTGDSIIFDYAGAYNFSSDFGSGSGIKTYMID
jgi:diaminopimelate decarboxylase